MGNQNPVPYVDIVNGNAPLPTDPSITRIARSGDGTLQASVGGSPYGPLGSSVASDWYSQEAAFHAAQTAVTESVAWVPGLAPLPTNVGDAGGQGGAVKGTGASGDTWGILTTTSIWQHIESDKWAISFRAVLPVITSGKAGFLGLHGGSNSILVGTDNGTSTTDFVSYPYNGTAGTAVHCGTQDILPHTWCFTSDGTAVKVWKDGALQGTYATNGAHFPTGTMSPAILQTSTLSGMALYGVLYSFAAV